MQALILNQYKQEVAAKNGINLKPIILFKAQRTIAESRKNKADFHKLIDELTANQIYSIQNSGLEIVQRAFHLHTLTKTTSVQISYYSLDNFLFFRDKKQKRGYPFR